MKNLHRVGPSSFTYTLAYSKSNQTAADRPENVKPLKGIAGEALQAWLTASGIVDGEIFRQVRKGGQLGEPLSPASVRDIVRKRAKLAGLPEVFSAHSLRSGFVTEAAIQKVPLADTMAMTGHKSVASVVGYYRPSNDNPAAKLL